MVKLPSVRDPDFARLTDHYAMLGLAPEATFREVQQAYWRLAFGGLNGPDRAALNAAYEVVGNERRRREYDELRSEAGLDTLEQTADETPPPPGSVQRADAGLRGKLGWPSV